jgi:hypothetical protein
MKQEWINTLRQMRDAGFAVIIWTPEELGDVDAKHVEDMSISYASEYLIPAEEETETGEDLAQFFGPSAR